MFGIGKSTHIFELSQSTLANQKRILSNWLPFIQSPWARLAGKMCQHVTLLTCLSLFSTHTRKPSEERKEREKKGQASIKPLWLHNLLLLFSVSCRGMGLTVDGTRHQRSGPRKKRWRKMRRQKGIKVESRNC